MATSPVPSVRFLSRDPRQILRQGFKFWPV